jgi:hypothetical protein
MRCKRSAKQNVFFLHLSDSVVTIDFTPLLFTVKIKALQNVADQSALQASVSDRRVIELTYENEQVGVMMNYSICYQLSARVVTCKTISACRSCRLCSLAHLVCGLDWTV